MTNTIAEITGHVTLRGHRIEIGSEIAHQFGIDCCRFVEGLVNEETLRKKYGLLSEEAWQQHWRRQGGSPKPSRIGVIGEYGDCPHEL
jgi:hypothetical protein